MFRNRGGERDLDQIILAALRGMERALAEFPKVRAGIMLLLDRRLSKDENAVVVRKAIKYQSRGVVGIDIAGPLKDGFKYEDYADLYAEARANGLKTTVHTGEDGTVEEMDHVLNVLPLDRLNHGFRAYTDPKVMEKVVKKNLTMCMCPTSNLSVGFIKDLKHLKEVIQTLWKNDVKFCMNTDNPSMLNTNLRKEIDLLRQAKALTEDQINQTIKWAFEASFVPTEPGKNLYL
jgi:adenosine deaminase